MEVMIGKLKIILIKNGQAKHKMNISSHFVEKFETISRIQGTTKNYKLKLSKNRIPLLKSSGNGKVYQLTAQKCIAFLLQQKERN